MKAHRKPDPRESKTIMGKLSGKKITLPDVNLPPMPALASPGVIHNGRKAAHFGEIDSSRGYPDVRSFRRKFGLIVPATNPSMEHEPSSIIFKKPAIRRRGLHAVQCRGSDARVSTALDWS